MNAHESLIGILNAHGSLIGILNAHGSLIGILIVHRYLIRSRHCECGLIIYDLARKNPVSEYVLRVGHPHFCQFCPSCR